MCIKNGSFAGVLALALLSGPLSAQENGPEKTLSLDQVVITATKFDKKSSETGKVVRVISLGDLEKMQGKSLVEILNEQAGLVINNVYGPAGSNTSYYLRGAASKYTAIQIDGIPVTDASAFTTFFDLNMLSPDQVERIEILRGANSTLHGSGAVAGVINIITKKGGNKPLAFNSILSAGSYNTYRGYANVYGSVEDGSLDYNVGYTYLDSEGFSTAAQPDTATGTFDKDGFRQQALNANFTLRPTRDLSIKPYLRYSRNEYDFDYDAFQDAPNNGDNQALQSGLGVVKYLDRGQLVASYAYMDFNREVNDLAATGGMISVFEGKQHHAESYFNYRISELFQFIAGVDFIALASDAETPYGAISSDTSRVRYGSVYGSAFFSLPSGFNLELGGRINRHSLYGNNLTYTLNPSYLIDSRHKLFFNMASAFRVPVLDELYSAYGNPNLEPERSQSYELGYEGIFAGGLIKFALTGFMRDVKDVITYGPQFHYINFDRQEDHGAEVEVEAIPLKNLKVNAFYSWTDGEVTQGDTSYYNLYKRPRHSAGLRLAYELSPRAQLSLNSRYMGERTDLVFIGESRELSLDPFLLLDLYGEYRLNKQLKIFADLRNITDAEYIESTGFNTRGFNFTAGVQLSL